MLRRRYKSKTIITLMIMTMSRRRETFTVLTVIGVTKVKLWIGCRNQRITMHVLLLILGSDLFCITLFFLLFRMVDEYSHTMARQLLVPSLRVSQKEVARYYRPKCCMHVNLLS